MLLALEIGNSTVTAGAFRGPQPQALRRTPTHGSDDPATVLAGWLAEFAADAVAVAGVVPDAVAAWAGAARDAGREVTVFDRERRPPVSVDYVPPEAVGVDRLLDVIAVAERWGGPRFVVDCGTATTINVVLKNGGFGGGAILAGLGLQREALAERTAQLPEVLLDPPTAAVGRSTVGGLRSGLLLGHAEAVRGLCERMRRELGWAATPRVGTGGWSERLAETDPTLFEAVDPTLTLQGLYLAWARAREARTASL